MTSINYSTSFENATLPTGWAANDTTPAPVNVVPHTGGWSVSGFYGTFGARYLRYNFSYRMYGNEITTLGLWADAGSPASSYRFQFSLLDDEGFSVSRVTTFNASQSGYIYISYTDLASQYYNKYFTHIKMFSEHSGLHIDDFALVGVGYGEGEYYYGDGGGGSGDYDTWYSNMVVTYMVLFIFIIVPPLIIAFEFAKHDVDPLMGFIGGLCLTVPMAYMVHIIELWVLFVFVLGLILMVLSKLGAFNRF